MVTVTVGVAMFTVTIVSLVGLLMVARRQLVATGDVTITVNDDPDACIHAPAGGHPVGHVGGESDLYSFGLRGQRHVRCLQGDGALGWRRATTHRDQPRQSRRSTRARTTVLPSQGQAGHEDRDPPRSLPCASMAVPRSLGTTTLPPLSRSSCSSFRPARRFRSGAGGYIQIEAPAGVYRYEDIEVEDDYRPDWDKFKLWRYEARLDEPVTRAYSMANYPEERDVIMLNVRIASPPPRAPEGTPPGKMTAYAFNLKPGDEVTISGPFGEFFAKDTEAEMVFVGGGAGMAPMRSHIFDLFPTAPYPAQGELLVWRPQLAGGVLRRRL